MSRNMLFYSTLVLIGLSGLGGIMWIWLTTDWEKACPKGEHSWGTTSRIVYCIQNAKVHHGLRLPDTRTP